MISITLKLASPYQSRRAAYPISILFGLICPRTSPVEHCNCASYTVHMPYSSKTDHRDGTALKSQWTIIYRDEIASFELATREGWSSSPTTRWGLHLNPRANNLGQSASAFGTPTRALFIAKFVHGNANDAWHGYPADPYRNPQDIPPNSVLRTWTSLTHLRLALIRKIVKGQLCSL